MAREVPADLIQLMKSTNLKGEKITKKWWVGIHFSTYLRLAAFVESAISAAAFVSCETPFVFGFSGNKWNKMQNTKYYWVVGFV